MFGLVGMWVCLIMLMPIEAAAKAKPHRAPRSEPELKIADLNMTPQPYVSGNGPLELSVIIQLPKEITEAAVLEVTALISSPSKTTLRFLTHRQPVHISSAVNGETERSKLPIHLSWDGKDHRKQPAGPGLYAYEVKTKLLADGEKGLRTMMVAWPKRGTLEVK